MPMQSNLHCQMEFDGCVQKIQSPKPFLDNEIRTHFPIPASRDSDAFHSMNAPFVLPFLSVSTALLMF